MCAPLFAPTKIILRFLYLPKKSLLSHLEAAPLVTNNLGLPPTRKQYLPNFTPLFCWSTFPVDFFCHGSHSIFLGASPPPSLRALVPGPGRAGLAAPPVLGSAGCAGPLSTPGAGGEVDLEQVSKNFGVIATTPPCVLALMR